MMFVFSNTYFHVNPMETIQVRLLQKRRKNLIHFNIDPKKFGDLEVHLLTSLLIISDTMSRQMGVYVEVKTTSSYCKT